MNAATASIRIFGIYIIVLGIAVMIAPNLVLAPFGIPPTSEVWLRVVGVLVLAFGYYYVLAAHAKLEAFYRATVLARTFVFLAFVTFVLLRLAHPALIFFGTIDLLGAAWTFTALKRSRNNVHA